jgi:acetyl-CoA C-acetyltransferase
MLCEAALQAMDDAARNRPQNVIDQVFVGSMGSAWSARISGAASAVVDTLNSRPAMARP